MTMDGIAISLSITRMRSYLPTFTLLSFMCVRVVVISTIRLPFKLHLQHLIRFDAYFIALLISSLFFVFFILSHLFPQLSNAFSSFLLLFFVRFVSFFPARKIERVKYKWEYDFKAYYIFLPRSWSHENVLLYGYNWIWSVWQLLCVDVSEWENERKGKEMMLILKLGGTKNFVIFHRPYDFDSYTNPFTFRCLSLSLSQCGGLRFVLAPTHRARGLKAYMSKYGKTTNIIIWNCSFCHKDNKCINNFFIFVRFVSTFADDWKRPN